MEELRTSSLTLYWSKGILQLLFFLEEINTVVIGDPLVAH